MKDCNKFNAVCANENDLLAFKEGILPDKDKQFLTEHLLLCDTCLISLQFLPFESISHKNSVLAKDTDKSDEMIKKRTSIPENLRKAFERHRKIRAARPKVNPVAIKEFLHDNSLLVGQIWRTKHSNIVFPSQEGERYYDCASLGSVPHLVMVTNPAFGEFIASGKFYQKIKVITLDNNIHCADEGDFIVTDEESPLGYQFMIQAWNQSQMLVQNLDSYLGSLMVAPKSFKSNKDQDWLDYLSDLGKKDVYGSEYAFIDLIKKGLFSNPKMRYRALEFEKTIYLSDPIDKFENAHYIMTL